MTFVLLTGANGYLGSALTLALKRARVPHEELRNANGTQFRLGDDPNVDQLQRSTALIHLAWTRAKEGLGLSDPNVQASIKLVDACVEYDTRFVFISSYAVMFSPHTWYSISKRNIEQYVSRRGGRVIRPALVVSQPPQSAYGQLIKFHKRLQLLPSRSGTPIHVHTISLATLTQCCVDTVLNPLEKELIHNCGNAQPVSLQSLVQKQTSKKVKCIPIPQRLLSIAIFVLKRSPRTAAVADSIDGLYGSSASDSDFVGDHV
jgi:nucleoside-diphosphate-sugar epimerase